MSTPALSEVLPFTAISHVLQVLHYVIDLTRNTELQLDNIET